MAARQRIIPVRREYNRWVANQTLEDYALRFTAKSARQFSSQRISQTAIGAISFLALEAIGGAITLSYGTTNAFYAIIVASIAMLAIGLPISRYAIRHGVDIDLLTRGASFGYIGSTITSLIYASFTFMLFAIEASIMSGALELTLGIPLWIGYIISAVMVIPLVTPKDEFGALTAINSTVTSGFTADDLERYHDFAEQICDRLTALDLGMGNVGTVE